MVKWVRRNRTAIAGPVLRVHPSASAIKVLPVNDLIIYQVYPSSSSFPNTLLYSSQEESNTSDRNDKLLNQSPKTGFEPATQSHVVLMRTLSALFQ